MPEFAAIIRQCPNPACDFRFPAPASASAGRFCPRCGWETQVVATPLVAIAAPPRPAGGGNVIVEALLDSIRSTYNVGSIFRAADGAGVRRLHLCGITPTPENSKVAKTALGAEQSVSWQYHPSALSAAMQLKQESFQLVALEVTPKARSIFEAAPLPAKTPLLLVVGNEVSGVDPELLSLCDQVVWIPMQGKKESLNVSLAFGIAAYQLMFGNS